MKTYDFLVIGSGIAGLSFALKASAHGTVGVLTKTGTADSNTAWAQGGIACVMGEDDSVDQHMEDTLDAGAGLCNGEVVRQIISEGPERINELIKLGVPFDRHENGALSLTREGGHSRRRILHCRDTTGREIEKALVEKVRENKKIEVLEGHFAVDLLTTSKLGLATQERCIGCYALNTGSGEVETFGSNRVVLASGGCGKVYLYSTNPDVSTGDGVAMAWRAGASIANMEFIQFHPTCLYHHSAKSFLISEAVRGEGGVLIGSDGQPFMQNYDTRESLAPRDIVARAIDSEMKRTGSRSVFVDITHKPTSFMRDRFPHIYETCLKYGIDATNDPIPVVPAAHYQCGGVQAEISGRTSIPGLYAIGEVACTGLHGANRLASNSLLEGAVMAHCCCEDIMKRMPPKGNPFTMDLPEWESGDSEDLDELVVIYHNWDEIRHLMWDYVSIVRTDKRLQRAATRLRNLKREVQEFYWNFKITADMLELRNLVDTAALIVESARLRRESRGLHYTLDCPDIHHKAQDTVLRRFI